VAVQYVLDKMTVHGAEENSLNVFLYSNGSQGVNSLDSCAGD